MKKWIIGSSIFGAVLLAAPVAALADADGAWQKQCAKCHGKAGKGDTKIGKKLKVADYSDAAWQAKYKDDDLLKAIRDGKGEKNEEGATAMPAFAADKVSDADAKAMVALIRSFAGKK